MRAEIKGGGWAVAEFSSDLSTKLTLKFRLCQEVPRGHSLPPSLSLCLSLADSTRNNASEFASNLNCTEHYELIGASLRLGR